MKKFSFTKFAMHLYLLIFTLFALFPLALLIMNGLKPKLANMTSPFDIPKSLTLDSVMQAWITAGYGQAYLNSIIVCGITICFVIVAASMAAYALTKLNFKGKNAVLFILLIIISVPLGVYLVPIFFIYIRLKLMDTIVGIIIIYCGIYLPFNVFLFRTYFLSIPKELNESAYIDGLNDFQVYLRIIMPISKPVIATVAIITGLWSWNEFFFANALLQSDATRTVATKYMAFTGNFSTDWNMISSAGIIAIVPILIAYFFLQDKFVSGITEGSIKG
jgi:raffinose/stachyose/melibiose transport system permease protein